MKGLLSNGIDPETKRKEDAAKKNAAAREEQTKFHFASPGASADLEWPAAGGGDSGDDSDASNSDIGATVWKVVGAAAAGITATGFVIALGGAVFWIRFEELGLPATQAVGLLAKNELLVQGAQETITFVGIAIAAVGLLFVVDPEGKMTRLPFALLGLLALGAAVYVWTTQLPSGWQLLMTALPIALFGVVVVVGIRSEKSFWPLALTLFVASLLFSAATGLLVVQNQSFAQAAAVLRGSSDAGLTGIYVTANDDRVYLGRLIPGGDEDGSDRRDMFDVPREGATLAVGPLESVGKAEADAEVLLEQLKADRERNPTAASGEEEPSQTESSEDDDSSAATTGAEGESGDSEDGGGEDAGGTPDASASSPTSPEAFATVAKAFAGKISVHATVSRPWGCLVRFASAEAPETGHWWTTCQEAGRFEAKEETMIEIRRELALPGRFQPSYDMRVEAHLRKGSKVLYLTGTAAEQCEHESPTPCLHNYSGGGEQVYLPEPQVVLNPTPQCTASRQDEIPVWERCVPR